MKSEPVIEIEFGEGGNDALHLGAGWSGDEPGYRWTIGGRSEVWLNHPGSVSDLILELDVSPFVVAPSLPAQRLQVRLRDTLIADTALTGPCKLGFRYRRVPWQPPPRCNSSSTTRMRDVRPISGTKETFVSSRCVSGVCCSRRSGAIRMRQVLNPYSA